MDENNVENCILKFKLNLKLDLSCAKVFEIDRPMRSNYYGFLIKY